MLVCGLASGVGHPGHMWLIWTQSDTMGAGWWWGWVTLLGLELPGIVTSGRNLLHMKVGWRDMRDLLRLAG